MRKLNIEYYGTCRKCKNNRKWVGFYRTSCFVDEEIQNKICIYNIPINTFRITECELYMGDEDSEE